MKFLEFAKKIATEQKQELKNLTYPEMKLFITPAFVRHEISALNLSKHATATLTQNIFGNDLSLDRLVQQVSMYVSLIKKTPEKAAVVSPKQKVTSPSSASFFYEDGRISPDSRARSNCDLDFEPCDYSM